MKHGLICLIIPPAFSSNFLTGKWPLFLVNSPANTFACGFSVAPKICGILLFNLWKILLRFKINIFLSKSLNSLILFSWSSPINVAKSLFSTNKILSKESAKFPSTNALMSSFLIFLFSIDSTNNSEVVPLSEFLVFKYWDHKWRLESWPLQLYNWVCHSSKETSLNPFLNINLLLGLSFDFNLSKTLANSSPESI